MAWEAWFAIGLMILVALRKIDSNLNVDCILIARLILLAAGIACVVIF